jgi:hypothetical protein
MKSITASQIILFILNGSVFAADYSVESKRLDDVIVFRSGVIVAPGVDSGARCNGSMRSGFARLCQAL